MSTGKVSSEAPPAMALAAPATRPAPISTSPSAALTLGQSPSSARRRITYSSSCARTPSSISGRS